MNKRKEKNERERNILKRKYNKIKVMKEIQTIGINQSFE